jgi:hypothetical protein
MSESVVDFGEVRLTPGLDVVILGVPGTDFFFHGSQLPPHERISARANQRNGFLWRLTVDLSNVVRTVYKHIYGHIYSPSTNAAFAARLNPVVVVVLERLIRTVV